MSDCVDFGVVSEIEFDKDYSNIGGPDAYKAIYKQYQCVSIPDDIINEWIPLAKELSTFLCTLRRPYKGIDHYGVTIIPPESIKSLLDIVLPYIEKTDVAAVKELVLLLNAAFIKGKYIICFGV